VEDIFCPACEGKQIKQVFHRKNKDNRIKMHASGFSRGNRDLYQCKNCEIIFCYPMPLLENLEESYAIESDSEFVSQNSSRILTFTKHLKWLEKEMKLFKREDRILDVGSAGGAFLEAARLVDISAEGLEINSWLVNWGNSNYRIDLTVGSIGSIQCKAINYKAISLWDVLEHLPNPQESLDIITSRITKDGYLILSLPNTDSFSFRLMRWSWPMHLDVHLLYFNSNSIEKLMRKYNFELKCKKVNRQTLSLGYILIRVLKQFRIIKDTSVLSTKLLTRWPSRINVTYSIGQTIFLFQKNK
jgi:2-polyprenyl-3-methyl-5-hydroxy-6-metoxy-1,4-benzoquinol methylase